MSQAATWILRITAMPQLGHAHKRQWPYRRDSDVTGEFSKMDGNGICTGCGL